MKYDSRIYVSSGKAVIRCPDCDFVKQIQVDKFKEIKHSLRIKCTCGKDFQVDLNFREGIRKKTELKGLYRPTAGENRQVRQCAVVDLSLRGLRLKVDADHGLQPGDEIVVKFSLDNKFRTEVERKVGVRNKAGDTFVGGEFIEPAGEKLNQQLCVYLMN